MQKEKYELLTDPDVTTFRFISKGPNGDISKLIIYQKTTIKNVYNLAFGDWDETTNDIDDKAISNNNDSEKILATVASTVLSFTYKYPKSALLVKGSTKSRTRLYRIGISNNFEEINQNFDVLGYREEKWQPFNKNTEYEAFLVKRKKIKNERYNSRIKRL